MESAQFAAHYGLDRLICLVDNNKDNWMACAAKSTSHGEGIGKISCLRLGWAEVRDGNDVEQVYMKQ